MQSLRNPVVGSVVHQKVFGAGVDFSWGNNINMAAAKLHPAR